MSNRKVKMLGEMFDVFANEEDREAVEKLYNEGRKGSAVALMLRRVHKKFFELLEGGLTEKDIKDLPRDARVIKITVKGKAKYDIL